MIHSNIIFPSTSKFHKRSLPFRFSNHLVLHAIPISYTWFNHPNNIWWCEEVMKVLKESVKFHIFKDLRQCIQKFPDWVDNEINSNNKHSLRSNTKGYGGKTH
jgi:hypothetical protein